MEEKMAAAEREDQEQYEDSTYLSENGEKIDYTIADGEVYEPYEYESDSDLVASEDEVADEGEDDDAVRADEEYNDFLVNLKMWNEWDSQPQKEPDRPELFLPFERIEILSSRVLEHVAGPGCIDERGYQGYAISFEEMKGCTTLQCLAKKRSDWSRKPDDQDFEWQSNYFLTGISDYMPSRDESLPTVVPSRHGYEHPLADIFLRHVSCLSNLANPLKAVLFVDVVS